MSSKVQPISMEDNSHAPNTTIAPVSTTVSPKVSLFAKKSGFVIPKNKLSGSLVPAFQGKKKPGGADVESEESTKQIPRKTKWGPDLTQDAFVKKGRASAYQQTRLDQITQLKSGILEVGDDLDQDSQAAQESSDDKVIVKSELEVERREIIGEILKLNPSYKVPPDYKPMLKEDKVAIPIKDYPGHNFIGLIFGPGGDTKKQLEKETGAKIRVYGTKVNTKKESEITSSDGNEVNGDYEKLYVLVTAETYEKVDAAVSLIELLVTPVLANAVAVSTNDTVSGDTISNMVSLNQYTPVVGNIGSGLVPQLVRFQPYPNQWVPPVPSPQFIAPPLPIPSNSGAMPSSVSPRPVMSGPNMSQMQNLGNPGPPRNPSLPPHQPNFSTPAGPNPNVSPMGSAISRQIPPYTFPERPLTSNGWSQPSARTLGPNMPQLMRPMVRPLSPQPIAPPPPVGFQTGPPNPTPTSWFPSSTTPTSIQPPLQSPPITAVLRPQQSSSNDFTFQSNRAQTPFQFVTPKNPQSPSFRPGMSNHVMPPAIQGFHRPQNSHQLGQHQGPGPQPVFPGHGPRPPPNHVGPGPRQLGPGSVSPVVPFPPRPGTFGSVQQIQPGFRPQNLNHPFYGNAPYPMGRPGSNPAGPQQVYDPFSPTAVAHKPGNPQNSGKQDNDPEYDDLMASVGVK
ncbi:hypothetical protein R6Q57_017089 [Mikania cordata]